MPAAVSACSRSRGAPSAATTQSGACRALCDQPALGGSRSRLSSTTRTGERSPIPGKRQVSSGSSDRTVPMPVSTASFIARMRCTRAAAASPVILAGLRPARRDLAVRRDRKLERDMGAAILHAPDVPGMRPPRLLRADADFDHDAGFRHAPMAGTRDLADWDRPAPKPRARCRPR